MPSRPAGAHARKPARKWSADDRALMRADKVLRRVMEERGPIDPAIDRRGSRPDPFEAVARAIVGQQLSTKAAQTINQRVLELYGGKTPTPEQLIETDPEDLRGAGLSYRKAEYLRDLAEHVVDGRLELDRFGEMSDDQVIAELTAVKGLGVWTAHMFLMFHLRRPNVLPVGDLGIRRAMQRLYGLDDLPDADQMTSIAEPWRPYRTLACLYLWRSLDNEPA